ncbi:hypothetical protein GCM10027051_01200 [Niabella terrae]
MVQLVLLFQKFILGFLLLTIEVHPYHVSATEMEYNRAEERIELSVKIFTDDFENVLRRLNHQKVDLTGEQLRPQMTKLIHKYLTRHLILGSDDKVIPLELFGWEKDHEAIYVYAIAKAPAFNPARISVANTILYELFTDQVNIMHFIVDGKRKSTKLIYPNKRTGFSF